MVVFLRLGQDGGKIVARLRGEPGAVIRAEPVLHLGLIGPIEAEASSVNIALGSVPAHLCRIPLGNMRSRLVKYVPGPATRFTSRPGYSVTSACAVSIVVLPPPITQTGPLLG